jgi:hypothetical protein
MDPILDQLELRMAEATARGKLKVFFGAFPGAGKTDAMLAAARRMKDSGRDVVIGLIDMHGTGKEKTAAAGFEVVPPAGSGELDLDAVLRRHPEVALIDDLAHANPPGARHPKRWNDIDELLNNGIDVFTTVNIQHLESLNDVVAQITGIRVRETIPDRVLDRADEVKLIDLSPEELIARLLEGTVYLPQQAERAIVQAYQEAEPAWVGDGPWAAIEVAVVACPGGAGEALRELARRAIPVMGLPVVDSRDDLTVYREWPVVPLAALPILGPAAAAAYAALPETSQCTPHARLDVTAWLDVDAD